jgi:predicted nucleotidyltransferase
VTLDDLPGGLLPRIVERCRREEPEAIGIFAFGSYVQGTAQPRSDLDLQIVTPGEPRGDYRTWFEDGRHVAVSAKSVSTIRGRCADSASWALWFAVESPGAWVWSTPAAVEAFGDPPAFTHPAGRPEVEDFVEWCSKALRASDSLALRVAARGLGEEAPALLRELNDPPAVFSRLAAVHTALAYAEAPAGWSEDLPVLLGLTAADDSRVRLAVTRVGRGTLALLRERGSAAGSWQPDLNRYLLDGTLERHLGFE